MKQDFMLKEGGICTRMELTVANPYTRRLPGCVGGICFHFSEIPKSSSLNEYIVSGTVSELRSFLRLKLPEWSLKDRYAYDLILDTVDGIKE
jgi:hypothetical protein